MPDFRAPLVLCLLNLAGALAAQNAADPAGLHTYNNNCSVCHGGDGLGGEHGPAIAWRISKLSDEELIDLIQHGRPDRGMPAFAAISSEKVKDLIAFLHGIESQKPPSYPIRKIQTTDGATLEGSLLSESRQDLALRTPDERIHLLRSESGRYREVTSQVDWTSYNGALNRTRRL